MYLTPPPSHCGSSHLLPSCFPRLPRVPRSPLTHTPHPHPASVCRGLHSFLAEPGPGLRVVEQCLCLGDRMEVHGHVFPPVGANGGEQRAQSWSWNLPEPLSGLLSSQWSEWAGARDHIVEPNPLTCAHLRKPLALRRGPGLILQSRWLPPRPPSLIPGVSCVLRPPADSLCPCLPHLDPHLSLLCIPLGSGPHDISRGPSPVTSSVGDPGPHFCGCCFFFFPEG